MKRTRRLILAWSLCFTLGCGGGKDVADAPAPAEAVQETTPNQAAAEPFLWVVLSDGVSAAHTEETLYQMRYRIVQGKPGDYFVMLNTGEARMIAPVHLNQEGVLQVRLTGVEPFKSLSPVTTIVEKVEGAPDESLVQRSGNLSYVAGQSAENPIDFLRFGPAPGEPLNLPWIVLSNFKADPLGKYAVDYKVVSGDVSSCYWVMRAGDGVAQEHVTLEDSGTLKVTVVNDFDRQSEIRSFISSLPLNPLLERDEPMLLSGTIRVGGLATTSTPPQQNAPESMGPPTVIDPVVAVVSGSKARLTNGVFVALDREEDGHIDANDGPTAAAFIALFDTNGDGELHSDEVVEQLPLPRPTSFKPITAIEFSVADANRDGEVTLADKPDDIRSIRRKIRSADADSDGKLSSEEIDETSLFAINEAGFKAADANQDGLLTEEEFKLSPGVFRLYDVDADGSVSPAEAARKNAN